MFQTSRLPTNATRPSERGVDLVGHEAGDVEVRQVRAGPAGSPGPRTDRTCSSRRGRRRTPRASRRATSAPGTRARSRRAGPDTSTRGPPATRDRVRPGVVVDVEVGAHQEAVARGRPGPLHHLAGRGMGAGDPRPGVGREGVGDVEVGDLVRVLVGGVGEAGAVGAPAEGVHVADDDQPDDEHRARDADAAEAARVRARTARSRRRGGDRHGRRCAPRRPTTAKVETSPPATTGPETRRRSPPAARLLYAPRWPASVGSLVHAIRSEVGDHCGPYAEAPSTSGPQTFTQPVPSRRTV